jgi:hypothetical protein
MEFGGKAIGAVGRRAVVHIDFRKTNSFDLSVFGFLLKREYASTSYLGIIMPNDLADAESAGMRCKMGAGIMRTQTRQQYGQFANDDAMDRLPHYNIGTD